MAKLGSLVATVGADLRGWNKAMGDVKRDVNRMTGNVQAAGRTMTAAFTLPVAYLAGTGLKAFMGFEQQMAKVKAVSGATGSEFAALTQNAKDLGASTRFTASEVAGLQLEYAKLGFSTDEILKVTEATLDLAQATDSDLAQAAEVAGSTLRAFGMDASETGKVADVMASAFSNSALDMDRFAESMKFVAPVANAAGMGIEETTAMLEIMADAGIHGSQAGTALRRIITDLGDTGGDTAGAIKKLAGEGITMSSAMDEVGRNAQSALLVLANGIGDFDNLTEGLNNSAGAAKSMADIMDNVGEGSMKKMQSAIEGAQISIGEALAPTMVALADNVADLANWFTGLDSGMQGTIMTVTGVVAVIGPLLVMIPKAVQGFGMMRTTFQALNKTMLANPIVLVTAAVVALGLALSDYVQFQDAATVAQGVYEDAVTSANVITAKQMSDVDRLSAVVLNEAKSEDERGAALKRLNAIAPEYFGNLDMEAVKTGQLTTAVDQYRESLLNAAKTKVFTQQLEEQVAKMEELKAELGEGPSLMDDFVGAFMGGGGATIAMTKRITSEMGNTQAAIDLLTGKMNELNVAQDATASSTAPLTTSLEGVAAKATKIATEATKAADAIERIPDMEKIDSIGQDVSEPTLQGGPVDIDAIGTEGASDALANHQEQLQQTIGMYDQFGNSIGGAFGQVITGGAEAAEAFKAVGASMLKSLLGVAKANVIATMSSPANPANAASGGLAMPALIAGGFALVEGLLGAIAFADGGIVSGPTLGLVGEYSGAKSNPEVIAPLDKLKGMMSDVVGGGAGGGVMTARIKGSDIILAGERGQKDLKRRR